MSEKEEALKALEQALKSVDNYEAVLFLRRKAHIIREALQEKEQEVVNVNDLEIPFFINKYGFNQEIKGIAISYKREIDDIPRQIFIDEILFATIDVSGLINRFGKDTAINAEILLEKLISNRRLNNVLTQKR